MTTTPTSSSHAEITTPISADLRRIEQEAQELPEPSPTAGMNLGQRILHVGGRENGAGYIEFGSVAAVRALVGQVLRDLQATPPASEAVPVLYVSPAQLEKHLDLEGAENAEAGRYLPARKTPAGKFTQPLYVLAAAPAQPPSSECDSPQLCRVHRGCAGRYGTKNTCTSDQKARPPSSFVNAADIYASDMPGTVVRKLDSAFHAAAPLSDSPAQPNGDARDMLSQAARDVLSERARQVDAEGFSHARDDNYVGLQLAGAAASYLILAAGGREEDARAFWPWRKEWLKPGDQRRYLEKAGALVLAEMERLDRAAQGGA